MEGAARGNLPIEVRFARLITGMSCPAKAGHPITTNADVRHGSEKFQQR
jgi:hypothetical protein